MTTLEDCPPDLVEQALADWRAQWPDLDLAPVAVIARLARAMSLLEPPLETTLRAFGLNRASFDTLSVLRRSGPPYKLSARQLAQRCMRTSATLTARIAHLAEQGLVTREADPSDARSVLIGLTDQGRDTIDAAVPVYLQTERDLLSGLDVEERTSLAHLLQVLLLSLEKDPTTSDVAPGVAVPALQVRMEQVHVALHRQRAVALPERPGLLVAAVHPGGVGAAAGLLVGDLVVKVAGTTFRSVAQLNHVLAGTDPRKSVTLEVVRGNDELKLRGVRPCAPGAPHQETVGKK